MEEPFSYVMSNVKTFSDFYDDSASDFPLISWLWYWISGDRAADRQLDQQMALNSQTAALDYEYAKKSALEMPSLNMKGLTDSGISSAAAAQALVGGSGVNAPTFSNSGSSEAPTAALLNSMLNFLPSLMQQKLVDAQTKRLGAQTDLDERRLGLDEKLTDHKIWFDKETIRHNAEKLGLDRKQLRLYGKLVDSQVGLNKSQIEKNFAELDKIASEIKLNMSSVQNLDAKTLHEFIRMDNTRLDTILKGAQVAEAQSSTMLNTQLTYESEARTNKTNAETVGQNLANDQQSMANFVKRKRLEISDALGFEIDAPEVTQCLESMVNGDFNALNKALSTTASGFEGTSRRIVNNLSVRGQNGKRYSGRDSYYRPSNKSSYRYHWYPGNN